MASAVEQNGMWWVQDDDENVVEGPYTRHIASQMAQRYVPETVDGGGETGDTPVSQAELNAALNALRTELIATLGS